MKKIIVTGGTGLIGKKIAGNLIKRGDAITIFSRNPVNAQKIIPGAAEYIRWDYRLNDWQAAIEGKDAVIHLAGESVLAGKWTDLRKKNILESRVDSTRALADAILKAQNKPRVFVSASAVGYYGNSEVPVDEESPAGKDFLADVVSLWENESKKIDSSNIRRVNIRTGIVLDKNEGAFARMVTPYKFFVGGPIGSGKQWFPWIHIEDVAAIFIFAVDNEDVCGILNAASPGILRMNEFCGTLGTFMHRPSFFKVPPLILKIMFGEGAEVLLNGACVIPRRTLEAGFTFKYESVKRAIGDLLK
ncbi:MAG: TIGR01777 family oxidoreductase [Melioribacteraceae bacterium]